jgi:hypothetical protein
MSRGIHFAAHQHLPDRAEDVRRRIDDAVEQGGGEKQGVDAPLGEGSSQIRQGRQVLIVDDDGAAVQERAPDFERGCVERQRRELQDTRGRVKAHVVRIAHQPDHGPVRREHGFGYAVEPDVNITYASSAGCDRR